MVESRVTDYQLDAFCLVMPRITCDVSFVTVRTKQLKLCFNKNLAITNTIKLAGSKYFYTSQIDMLLGAEFFLKLLEPEKIELGEELPTIHNTKVR